MRGIGRSAGRARLSALLKLGDLLQGSGRDLLLRLGIRGQPQKMLHRELLDHPGELGSIAARLLIDCHRFRNRVHDLTDAEIGFAARALLEHSRQPLGVEEQPKRNVGPALRRGQRIEGQPSVGLEQLSIAIVAGRTRRNESNDLIGQLEELRPQGLHNRAERCALRRGG